MDNQGRPERGDFPTWNDWAELLAQENIRARPDEAKEGTLAFEAWEAFKKEEDIIEMLGIQPDDWVFVWEYYLRGYRAGAHADE